MGNQILIYLPQEQISKLINMYRIILIPTSWSDLHFYAFPPFAVISKVISKIENEQAEGILVVPIFTTQIWFPRVMRLLIDYPLLLPDSNKSLFFPYRMKKHPVLPTTKLMACHVSGTLSKGLDFQKRLQSCTHALVERWNKSSLCSVYQIMDALLY